MNHRERILKVLADLPVFKRKRGSLSRNVLEGLARTPQEKGAAAALIDYMIAAGEIEMRGERRGATYGLPGKKPR